MTFWLSFSDPKKPKGQRFLGVSIITDVSTLDEALKKAWRLGCNPGGQVQAMTWNEGLAGGESWNGPVDRALTPDEIKFYGEPVCVLCDRGIEHSEHKQNPPTVH